MIHSITLLFNLSKLNHASEQMNQPNNLAQIILALARHLHKRQIQGTFLISGEIAQSLAQAQQGDVLSALWEHDLGLYLAQSPTEAAIYLAQPEWQDGFLGAWDTVRQALATWRDVFTIQPTCWATDQASWGPQLHAAFHRQNISTVLYPLTQALERPDLHWYAHNLVLPHKNIFNFVESLSDEAPFEQSLRDLSEQLDQYLLKGVPWSGLVLYSPSQWLAEHNQATLLNKVDRLLDQLQADSRLRIQTIADMQQIYPPPPQTIYLHQIDQALQYLAFQEDVSPHSYYFSPAELLDLMARYYTASSPLPETMHRRLVLGPLEEPPQFDPQDEYIYWADFLLGCRIIMAHVTEHGCLPGYIPIHGTQWSLGSFYQVALKTWADFRSARLPHALDWQPASLYPLIGHKIAVQVQETLGYHDPDISVDVNNLLMHTCFQCWTLRPAYED